MRTTKNLYNENRNERRRTKMCNINKNNVRMNDTKIELHFAKVGKWMGKEDAQKELRYSQM